MRRREYLPVILIILSLLPVLLLGYAFRSSFPDEETGNEPEIKMLSMEDGQLQILLEGGNVGEGSEAFLSLHPFEEPRAVKTWGKILDVKISAGYAFLANDRRGVHVVQLASLPFPKIVSTVETPGKPWRLEVKDGYCFVADVSGLQVIDVRQPHAPKRIVSRTTDGEAFGLSISKDLLLLCDGKEGIKVFDIKDPESPRLLSELDTPGYAFDVEILGETAYVADGPTGIQVVDISDPESPRISSHIETSVRANFVGVADGFLFFAGRDHLLEICHFDAGHALSRKTLKLPAKPMSAHVRGQRLYVSHCRGVSIFDLETPSKITLIESVQTRGTSFYSDVSEDLLFVANGKGGLQVRPLKEAPETTDDLMARAISPLSLAYAKQHLYVSTPGRVETFHWDKVSDPKRGPSVGSTLSGEVIASGGGIVAVADTENVVHFMEVDGSSGLSEFAQSRLPRKVDLLRLSGRGAFVASGDMLYHVDLAEGALCVPRLLLKAPDSIVAFDVKSGSIRMVTISGRYASVEVASLASKERFFPLTVRGEVVDAAFSGTRTYLLLSEGEILVVDSSASHRPKIVRSVPLMGSSPFRLLYARGYLAHGSGNGKVDLFDLSDQDNPQRCFGVSGRLSGASSDAFFVYTPTGSLSILSSDGRGGFESADLLKMDYPFRFVAVDGDELFLIDNCKNLRTYRLDGPRLQEIRVDPKYLGNVYDMVVGGEVCYLGQHERGIALLDISDPESVELLNEHFVSCDVRRLAFSRDYLLALDGHGLLTLYKAGGKDEGLHFLSEISTGGDAMDVALGAETAYVADGAKGLQVVDLSDPSKPKLLGRHQMRWPSSAFSSLESVEVSGDNLFAIYSQGGFQVFDIKTPHKPRPIAFLDIPGYLSDIDIAGRFAVLATTEGVVVIDVNNPKMPVVVDTISSVSNVKRVFAQNDSFFAVSPSAGLYTYALPITPGKFSVGSKRSLSLSFPVERGERYRLSLFDSSKRRAFSKTLDLKDLQRL